MASSDTPPAAPPGPGLRLGLLALAQFIITLDFNIVFVALPDIGRELGFTVASLQWVFSAYVVALGGLLLFGGRAADRIGARRMFMVGLSVYAVSSLVGGLAGSPGVLIAARAAQGVGGALLFPTTLRLIFTNFAEGPVRNRALVIYGAVGGVGLSAGALAGGLLTNYTGWEWVFFVNVPLAAFAVAVAPRVLAADPPRPGPARSFDVPGALLATAGATLLVLGLASGPEAGWGSARGAGSIAVGVLLLAAFLFWERRAADPLMPLRLLKHRSLAVTMGVAFVYQGALGAVYYLFTTYMQDVLDYSPLAAGLGFLPPTLIGIIGATAFATPVLNKYGFRDTLFAGALITGVGTAALIASFSTDGSYWTMAPGLAIWALGGALAVPAFFAGAGAGISPLEQGVSAAMATTARQIGGAVGLAVLVAIATAGLDAGSTVAAADDVVAGLRTAGWWAAAATIAGAFITFALPRPKRAPAPAAADAAAEPAG